MLQIIKRFPNYMISPEGKIYNGRGKEVKSYIHKNGVCEVGLYSGGTRTKISVHYLVAETYIDNPNKLPNVIHKDGNLSNNFVENLEWSEHLDNHKGGFYKGVIINEIQTN